MEDDWEDMSPQQQRRWAYITTMGDFRLAEKLVAWIEDGEDKGEAAPAPINPYTNELKAKFEETKNDE